MEALHKSLVDFKAAEAAKGGDAAGGESKKRKSREGLSRAKKGKSSTTPQSLAAPSNSPFLGGLGFRLPGSFQNL
jgi:hypothetical protein